MCGQGGRGVQGKGNVNQGENGVDIRYPTRWYGKEEWLKIRCNTQKRILYYPARSQALNERRNKKRRTANATASVTNNEDNPKQNRIFATIINGVQTEPQQEQVQSTHIRYPTNGS